MEKSTVYVNMNDEEFDCSYAIVDKDEKSVIIIFVYYYLFIRELWFVTCYILAPFCIVL